MQNDNRYQQLSEDEVASLVGLTKKTLQKKRKDGTGPRYVRVSAKCVRYRLMDIIAWQENLLIRSTAEGQRPARPLRLQDDAAIRAFGSESRG